MAPKLAQTPQAQLAGNNGQPDGDEHDDLDDEQPPTDTEGDDDDEDEDDEDPDGANELGDPGKKALDRMKAERNQARKDARARQKEIDELRRERDAADKTPDERALDEARREAAAAATEKANQRILRSEVRGLAAGKLKDPSDALAYLDLTDFEADDDGEFDSEEISAAIADLLERKPYLAAQGGTASFDSTRGKRRPVQKLTRDDLKTMTPEQIVKAKAEGRIDT